MTGLPFFVSKLSEVTRASLETVWHTASGVLCAPSGTPAIDRTLAPSARLPFERETDLRNPVAQWIAATWHGAHVADEVGPRWAPADLVAEAPPVGSVPGALVSVELKLRDGRRALAQATLHQLFADLSYIAMPAGRVSMALLLDAGTHGVGVLSVHPNGQVDCMREATPATPGQDLASAAADTVRASAHGLRQPVPVGGSRGGAAPLVTAP